MSIQNVSLLTTMTQWMTVTNQLIAYTTQLNDLSNTVANSSNAWSNSIGVSSNAWANTVGTTATDYASNVGVSANAYAVSIVVSSNAWANTIAFTSANNANLWANTVAFTSANNANLWANTVESQIFPVVNAAFGTANAAFNAANNATTSLTPANNWANTIEGVVFPVINASFLNANSAFSKANSASITITTESSSANTYYPTFTTTTSGNASAMNVSTAGLNFVPSTGTLSATIFNSLSDKKLKKNIKKIVDPLETVKSLKGMSFQWKATGNPDYGVIAQQVENVVPQLVTTSGENKAVHYDGLTALLIEAVKELSVRVDKLEKSKNV